METERRRLEYRRQYHTRGAAKADRSERFVRRTVIQSIVCAAVLLCFYIITLIDAPFCKDLVSSARNTLEYTIDIKETAAMITDKTKSFVESVVKSTAPEPSPTTTQEEQTDVSAD